MLKLDWTLISSQTISTLVGAFSGALLAFFLSDSALKRKHKDEHAAALNKALFVIISQLNTVAVLRKQLIDPFRANPARFIAIRPTYQLDYSNLKVNIESISFLLETLHEQIPMDILIAEEVFFKAIQSVNERSQLHAESVQRLLESAGIEEGKDYNKEEIEAALGLRLFASLQRATDQMIELLDAQAANSSQLIEKMHRASIKLYPKHKFIKYVIS